SRTVQRSSRETLLPRTKPVPSVSICACAGVGRNTRSRVACVERRRRNARAWSEHADKTRTIGRLEEFAVGTSTFARRISFIPTKGARFFQLQFFFSPAIVELDSAGVAAAYFSL